jgi:hypothetical protein
MMMEILAQFAQGALIGSIVIAGVMIIASYIHDVRAVSRRRMLRAETTRLSRFRQPHISILIYASNNDDTIWECLKSIRQSHYYHYDATVIDNMSNDATKKVVRRFGQRYPDFPLRLYAKRKQDRRSDALMQGYEKSQKGDLVLTIDATATFSKSVLKQSAAHFTSNKALHSLKFHDRYDSPTGLIFLIGGFLRSVDKFWKKCTTLLQFDENSPNVMYRAGFFVRRKRNTIGSFRYDESLVMVHKIVKTRDTAEAIFGLSEPSESRGLSRAFRIRRAWVFVTGIAAVGFVTYCMYAAATLQTSQPLISSWLVAVLVGVIVVWSDGASSRQEKIEYIISLPFMYFALYVLLLACAAVVMWRHIRYVYRTRFGRDFRLLETRRY